MLDILIPVLGRPQRVKSLFQNIVETTDVPYRLLFLCSTEDREEIEAIEEVGAEFSTLRAPPANGQYAKKINLGYRQTANPWLALLADDVVFHPGWASTAMHVAQERFSVVALNDMANSFVRNGMLATHALVRRTYVDEQGCSLDGPGVIYHEGYSHNFVDCELSVIARHRGLFIFARRAVVQHKHPIWGKAERDQTYEYGLRDFDKDRTLFVERMTPDYVRDPMVRRFAQAVRIVDRKARNRSRNRRQ